MTYYIKIGTEAWIELSAFQFTAESPAGPDGKNSLVQPGPASFGSVNVELASDALLAALIGRSLSDPQDIIIRATELDGNDEPQAIYDMVLGEAAITELNENMVGGPSLQLVFNEIEITTYTIDATKDAQPDGTFVWDVTTNDGKAESLPAIPAISDLENAAPAVAPAKFVMAIDGVGGSSDVEDHKGWFDISDFAYSFGRTYDLGKQETSNVVDTRFSVMLTDQTAFTALMSLAAKDELISAVQIKGLTSADILQTQTLFGNVLIESIEDDGANGYSVNFLYQQIVSDVFDPFDTKVLSHTEFDFALQKNEASITAPTPGFSFDTTAAVQYFLALPGLAGASVTSGHERWFNLEEVNFALDASGVLPEMSNVGLRLSDDTEIADIMARLVDGKTFAGATVRGIDGKGNIVYILDMGNVSIETLNDNGNGGFSLELDARQVELSSNGYNSSGVLKANPSFAWDFDTGQSLKSLASAAPGGKTPNTQVPPEKFYMLVDGMNGGSADPAHLRWFELTDFDFSAFMNGADPDFTAVQAALGDDRGLTAMYQAATMGSAIKGIRIEGVVDVGGIETKVYELALTDVRVESVSDYTGPGYDAGFDFGKFSLRTFDGLTGKQSGLTGWDRVNDTSFTTRPALGTSKGHAEAQATEFLFFGNGLDGDSELSGFKGASDITDYSFNLFQPTFEGANQGASELGRLTLTFATDTLLTDFLLKTSASLIFNQASLLGLSNKLESVFSIDLNGGLVTAVNDFSGAGFSVEIDFGKFGITQRTINPLTGQLGLTNTFGWDDALDQTTTVPGLKAGPAKKETVAPTSHFMAIDGFHGDLATVARGGWLEIADMTFSGSNNGEAGGGVGGGKFALGSITVSVASDSGLTELLGYMTTGKAITGVQIEGTALNLNNAERTVQAYTLGEVYVTSVEDRDGPGYFVTLDAARFKLEQFKLNGTTHGVAAWDFELNKNSGPGVIVNPGGSSGNDVLAGNREANTIAGLAGNDSIYGYDGNDTLTGGTGNDKLFGGNGDDTLSGGDNFDILVGNAGKDTLSGGSGVDYFRYLAASDSTPGVNRDIITDFQDGIDRIDVVGVTLPGASFIGGAAFTGSNQIRAEVSGADTIVQVNVNGITLEILVQNTNPANFSLADFIV